MRRILILAALTGCGTDSDCVPPLEIFPCRGFDVGIGPTQEACTLDLTGIDYSTSRAQFAGPFYRDAVSGTNQPLDAAGDFYSPPNAFVWNGDPEIGAAVLVGEDFADFVADAQRPSVSCTWVRCEQQQ